MYLDPHPRRPLSSPFYIIGAGGHGRELAWLAQRCFGTDRIIRFLVEPAYAAEKSVNGIIVAEIGGEWLTADSQFVAAVGDPATRERLASAIEATGAKAGILVDPTALISPTVVLGAGSVVCAGSILTTNICIGRHVHVNAGCLVHHDTMIGDFSTLSPGVRIAGHVRIGEGVFIGIGATIINGNASSPLEVGAGAVIAAGSCVTRRVEPGSLVAGVPAVRKR